MTAVDDAYLVACLVMMIGLPILFDSIEYMLGVGLGPMSDADAVAMHSLLWPLVLVSFVAMGIVALGYYVDLRRGAL